MSRKFFLMLGVAALLAFASSASAVVMLNKVLYDNQGTDDPNVLFTELWGTPGTSLEGWTIVGINGNGGLSYRTITLHGTIPADGYFVIANAAGVATADQVLNLPANDGVDWQNAGSSSGDDCDGLDLKDASNALIDHLCYGPCANPGGCTGEGGANAPDPFPSQNINKSVARIPDHQDTDNNAADWVSSDTPTPGASNSGTPCEPQYVDMADVRAEDANGVPLLDSAFVIVDGIVTVDNFVFDSTSLSKFFFQDDDAGANVFRIAGPENLIAGDCVTVSAYVHNYNGLLELTGTGTGNCVPSVQRTNHVNPPSPSVITCSSPMENFEGMLVRINGVTIISGSWPAEGQYSNNVMISDGNGTIELSINKWTNIDGSPQPQGTFDVVGIISQYDVTPPYNSYYEILPRSTADIRTLDAGDPTGAVITREFSLLNTYPNPFNSTAQIRYEVGSARQLTLSIYDVLGREVLNTTLTGLTPGAHTYSWTPEGASGLYMLKLEGASDVQFSKLLYLK